MAAGEEMREELAAGEEDAVITFCFGCDVIFNYPLNEIIKIFIIKK